MTTMLVTPLELISCEAAQTVGHGLKEIQLLPWGVVQAANRAPFIVNAESAREIEAAFKREGSELLVDYEHQSLGGDNAAPDGTARAAGWIKQIFARPDKGIFGLITWNPRAAEFIRAGEYKFMSPVIAIRKVDRVVMGIDSAALTNRPAISGMERVAASRKTTNEMEKTAMAAPQQDSPEALDRLFGEIKALLTDMGIEVAGDGSELILRAALDALKQFKGSTEKDAPTTSEKIANAVRRKLKLGDEASESEIILALTVWNDRNGADTELATMRASEADRQARDRVEKYVKSNVINPKDEDQMTAALALSRENPGRFEALMSRATPWVASGETKAPSGPSRTRHETISEAGREFRSEKTLQGLTTVEAFVNDALRKKNLPKATETELAAL